MLKLLDKLINATSVFMLVVLIVVAFVQVVCRYVFSNALPWPEEICRFSFIALAYFGMVLMMRAEGHLRVDVLLALSPPCFKKILNGLTYAASSCYCFLAAWYACDMMLAIRDMDQMASSLELAIWLTWIPIPVGLFFCGMYAVISFIHLCRGHASAEA